MVALTNTVALGGMSSVAALAAYATASPGGWGVAACWGAAACSGWLWKKAAGEGVSAEASIRRASSHWAAAGGMEPREKAAGKGALRRGLFLGFLGMLAMCASAIAWLGCMAIGVAWAGLASAPAMAMLGKAWARSSRAEKGHGGGYG